MYRLSLSGLWFPPLLAGTALVFLTSGQVFAQPAAPGEGSPPAPAIANSQLQEIVVTARRKEESAQTVPVSLTAISAATLAAQGVETTNDLQRLVPGIILNGAGSLSNTTYTIRGQGKAVTGPGLPSVITYFNEIPLPSIGSYTPTFDMDNIQVLKGPQGTLFGRNTTGGAVLVYSQQPGPHFEGYVQADLGDYNKHYFQGALNVPVVEDKLFVRLAADIERRDGYTNDITTGQKFDDTNMSAGRLSVLATPTDAIKNSFVFDYTDFNTNGLGEIPFHPLNAGIAAAAVAEGITGRNVATSISPYEKETYWGVSNTTSVDFDILTVKNIFGYRYVGTDYLANADGLNGAPIPDLGLGSLGVVPGQTSVLLHAKNISQQKQISDEFQLSGTALDNKLSWLAGAFYLIERPDGPDGLAEDLFRPTPASATTSLIVNNFLGGAWPVGALADTLYGDQSKAIFGNLSYDLGSLLKGLKLNAGGRYTWDRESICSNGRASISLATGLSLVPQYNSVSECEADHGSAYGGPSFSSSVASKAPTYTLGLDYTLNDDVFLYFTTRSGYRAGGLNAPTLPASLSAFQTFKPQKVTDYEIGAHAKFKLDDWRGRFNIAAFTSEFSQLQLQATGITAASGIPGVTGGNQPANTALEINAGTATTQGVEVDGLLSPFRGLNFTYSATYLDEHYDTVSVPSILAPFFSATNFTGVPRWSFQTALQYYLPVNEAIGDVSVNASYYYIAKEYQGVALLPAYGLANFNINWSGVYGKPLDVTFYVDNAFDTTYVQDVLLSTASFGVYTGNYGPPRMFGVRARYSF